MADEQTSTIHRPFGGSFAIELTCKIMVAAICILFLAIVFVLILKLYSRWLLFRIVSDSATRPRSDPESALRKKGLDAAVLRSMPVVVFSPADFEEGLECAVCLSELAEGEKARLLPSCNHGFHVDCIDIWFKSNSTCPLCRRNPLALAPKSSNLQQDDSMESSIMETPIFPTNVLFWGNQMQISSRGVCLEEPAQTSSSSSSSSSASILTDGIVVIDIPAIPNEPSSSSSGGSGGGCSADEEMKSVVTNRLRTLKRLLSRERRIGNNPNSLDLEQVGIVQC